MRRGTRVGVVAACTTALLAFSVGSALAANPSKPTAKKKSSAVVANASAAVSQPAAANPTAAQQASDYWTPERMKTAKPADITVKGGSSTATATQTPAEPTGPPVAISGATTGAQAPSGPGQPVTTPPFVSNGSLWPASYNQLQAHVNGKVFFTDPVDHLNYVCSGSAVNSGSKRVVWTAGHCVFDIAKWCDGRTGSGWMQNWIFVPAYNNGSAPYGKWSAARLTTLTGFCNGTLPSAFPYDSGAASVNLINGVRLVNRVGGEGITWNQPIQNQWSFGYPQAAPFNGATLRYCFSNEFRDNTGGFGSGSHPFTVGINCNVTGGASGGPWLTNAVDPRFSPGWGYVNGNNSYKYNNDPSRIYSPYFNGNQGNLYNAVANF